jgi:hypothetical protein
MSATQTIGTDWISGSELIQKDVEVVMTSLKVLFWHLPRQTGGEPWETSAIIAEIWTDNLLNTSQKPYRLSKHAWLQFRNKVFSPMLLWY